MILLLYSLLAFFTMKHWGKQSFTKRVISHVVVTLRLLFHHTLVSFLLNLSGLVHLEYLALHKAQILLIPLDSGVIGACFNFSTILTPYRHVNMLLLYSYFLEELRQQLHFLSVRH